ncbi:MAG: tetratricopeptide repeat protein [Candidatus Eisenbacteria bacterium]
MTTPDADALQLVGSDLPAAVWADQLYRLGIARYAHRDFAGALQALESIPFAERFDHADRAAFLLANVYLRLGHREGLIRLADQVSTFPPSGFTRWIQAQTMMSGTRGGLSGPGPGRSDGEADLLAVSWLLSDGRTSEARALLSDIPCAKNECRALALHLRGIADEMDGRTDWGVWTELGGLAPRTPLDRTWIDGARLRLARAALERGEDPGRFLALHDADARSRAASGRSVGAPSSAGSDGDSEIGSTADADARSGTHSESRESGGADDAAGGLDPWIAHLRGLVAWKNGDLETARATLERLLESSPDYPQARSAELSLAGIALESGDPAAARAHALRAEALRSDDVVTLQRIDAERSLDEIWKAWERGAGSGDPVRLDLASVRERTARWIEAALAPASAEPKDADPRLPERASWQVDPTRRAPLLVPVPPLESLRTVAASEQESWEAYVDLERARADIASTRRLLDRRRAYLQTGLVRTDDELRTLRASADALAKVQARIPDLEGTLESLRDESIRRFIARTDALRARIATERRWIEALERIYGAGPQREIPGPPDIPRAPALLDHEDGHAAATDDLIRAFAETVPDAIADAYDQAWHPRLTDGVADLESQLASLIQRAERVQSSIHTDLSAIERSDEMADLHERARRLAARADSLALVHLDLQRSVVRSAVDQALRSLDEDAEGIDYLAALATYELEREQTLAERADTTTSDTGSRLALQAEAIERHQGFLERYPRSGARADVRYRLADLLLTAERDRFQVAMAQFLETGAGVPPIFDPVDAEAQYRSILTEETAFAHRDAVLFQLGVLEADAGDPASVTHLGSLLEEHPDSEFRQEGELRLADYLNDDGRAARALSLYEAAARGNDRGLAAVALYKLGWARFRRDEFAEATDAFRRTLDLYLEGVPTDDRRIPDLRQEAEDYLVHGLARMGGGPAVADYFDQIGPRTYESRVFTDVTLLLRRFSLFPQAAETDRLWLARYPLDDRAPEVAARLIDSEEQAQRKDDARRDRLQLAELFVPGSAWQKEQRSDSLRAAADEFTRGSLRSVAWEHHRAARAIEERADSLEAAGASHPEAAPHWRDALALYERITSIWPQAPEASRDRFQAGEAAFRLGVYDRAFGHYTAAAEADTARFAPEAQWQRVAVLDAWYYATGSDSLARAFVQISGEYLDRSLADDRAAGLSWRRAHVALDHEWNALAEGELGRFVERFPGDDRVADAAALRGDALIAENAFDAAARAYETALRLARRADRAELVTRLEAAIPAAEFQYAESAEPNRKGSLFRELAERWPGYEHADLALYQSGLAYRAEDRNLEAAEAWARIGERYPQSEYARDAELELARAWTAAERPADAARVFEQFSTSRPDDPDAADALLRAAELWQEAGDPATADRVRLAYVDRYPQDRETARALLEPMAARDLEHLPRNGSVDGLIAESPALTRYLNVAGDDAGSGVLARIAFLRGEEARERYTEVRLDQPIQQSVVKKKEALETLLGAYRECATRAIAPWAHAATYRIGEALVGFGQELTQVDPPAELSDEDAAAYAEVLEEQAWDFFDQGEQVWSDLLRSVRSSDDGNEPADDVAAKDEGGWIRRTQESLWKRVPLRFVHFAEVEYPVIAAKAPSSTGREVTGRER